MTEAPQGSPRISRRSIAKGAAWAAPVVIASQAAAAHAASPTDITGTVCGLFFGTGNASSERMDVKLGFDTKEDVIPAGTVVTWTITMNGSTIYPSNSVSSTNYTQAPMTTYPGDPTKGAHNQVKTDTWTLETDTPCGDQVPSGTPLKVTWTANKDVQTSAVQCFAYLRWDTASSSISPGVTFSINSEGSNALSFQVPRRRSTSKDSSRALTFKSSSTGCYPEVNYSAQGGFRAAQGSTGPSCGAEGQNNTSTIYPNGSCAHVVISGGQKPVPAKCS